MPTVDEWGIAGILQYSDILLMLVVGCEYWSRNLGENVKSSVGYCYQFLLPNSPGVSVEHWEGCLYCLSRNLGVSSWEDCCFRGNRHEFAMNLVDCYCQVQQHNPDVYAWSLQ